MSFLIPTTFFSPAAGAAFSPSDLSGLKLWLKADALALSDADPVASWTDSSGNGYHGTAAGSVRPTYKTGIINSLPVVRFDGVDDFLASTTLSNVISASAYSIFIVSQASAAGTPITTGYDSNATLSDSFGYIYTGYQAFGTTPREISGHWDGGSKELTKTAAANTPALYWFSLGGGTLSAGKNGDAATTLAAGNVSVLTGTVRVGRNFSSFYLTGDIGEIVAYNVALGTTDRDSVITYLRNKWGV